MFVFFFHTFLFIQLFSYSDIALQSFAGGERQAIRYQTLATNPQGKISIVLLEISFRDHSCAHSQLSMAGLLIYLSKPLASL